MSPNVDPGHSWYEAIDKLEAYGCAYPTFRLIRSQTYEDLRSAVYVQDAEELCKAPEWLLAERARLFAPAYTNAASAGVFLQQNDRLALKGLEAAVTPLFPLRQGRPDFDGVNLNLEFRAVAQAGREDHIGYALGATPGFLGAVENYSNPFGRFYLQDWFVKLGYGWAEIAAGRLPREFGDARHGNLLLSQAAKPINSVELTIRPHILGSPLSVLGPFSLKLFAGNLDRSTFVDGARLAGLALGFRPAPWLELAWMELYQFGGVGVPSVEPTDLLKMLVYLGDPALEVKRSRQSVFQISLREAKSHTKIYVQAHLDGRSGQVSGITGLYFPKLGNADLRLEAAYTAPEAYGHPTYPQGLVYEGLPLGHPLGPDALGGYVDVGFPLLRSWRGEIQGFLESRNRHPGAGTVAEERLGGGILLKRHWPATTFVLEARAASITGAGYIPNELNQVVSTRAILSYSFF